jgi:hypothetical protein
MLAIKGKPSLCLLVLFYSFVYCLLILPSFICFFLKSVWSTRVQERLYSGWFCFRVFHKVMVKLFTELQSGKSFIALGNLLLILLKWYLASVRKETETEKKREREREPKTKPWLFYNWHTSTSAKFFSFQRSSLAKCREWHECEYLDKRVVEVPTILCLVLRWLVWKFSFDCIPNAEGGLTNQLHKELLTWHISSYPELFSYVTFLWTNLFPF